jgi:hypothetical protein
VRRAVDQLAPAQIPAALRPFSHWHPDALRDAARAREAVARALVSDARFRAEVAEMLADDDRRARAQAIDPLTLRAEVGADEAVALLAVTQQWSALATLAAALVDERSAAGHAASEPAPEAPSDGSRPSGARPICAGSWSVSSPNVMRRRLPRRVRGTSSGCSPIVTTASAPTIVSAWRVSAGVSASPSAGRRPATHAWARSLPSSRR